MPKEQEQFQAQVAALLEVAMFENWLRFYFIPPVDEEKGDTLKLELPEKSLERIEELYPSLYPLAQQLQGKEVDFATSRDAVLNHILAHVEGKTMPRGQAERVLQSQAFQIRLQLFHTWEQMHEDQLDRTFMDFGAWQDLFARWLESAPAQELARRMASA